MRLTFNSGSAAYLLLRTPWVWVFPATRTKTEVLQALARN